MKECVGRNGDAWTDGAAHDVTVTFINDKWNGTPDTDRNLWYLGAELNGIESRTDPQWLNSGGSMASAHFAPADPTQDTAVDLTHATQFWSH